MHEYKNILKELISRIVIEYIYNKNKQLYKKIKNFKCIKL